MSREVRRVPMDWQHPREWSGKWVVFKPLLTDLDRDLADFAADPDNWGSEPDPADYMPDFGDRADLGFCMYETTSEGTPISPVFATPEELARWLADTRASAFGLFTASYESWLAVARGGWAPSAVAGGGAGLRSGVEFAGETAKRAES